jgi:hypothetical protein
MDEANWSTIQRDLSSITDLEKNDCPSSRKRRILELNQRGYASILLNNELMQCLNEPNGVKQTLSNLVKYSSSSNFVFQKEKKIKHRRVLQNSGTR